MSKMSFCKLKCGKRRFDRIGAMLGLAKAQSSDNIQRLECRIY